MNAVLAAVVLGVVAMQGPGALQPGTGIVTGSLKTADGHAASGVRVGAVDIDDPTASSLLSVTETDSAGKYRLINIPAGHYYIVAGKLSDLHYFPTGADRSKAAEIDVEAARIRSDVNFTVPSGSQRPTQLTPGARAPESPEMRAFQQLSSEQVIDRKTQLVLQFEKNFPGSSRLAEAYISLSRTYASQQSNMDRALQYAEKATSLATGLRNQSLSGNMNTAAWQQWVASVDASAQSNLAWVKQMDAWQNKSLMSLMAPRRAR